MENAPTHSSAARHAVRRQEGFGMRISSRSLTPASFGALLLVFVVSLLSAQAPAAANERLVVPPEALVIEGIPSVPAALAQEVRRYTEVRSAAFLDWHPKQREILIATRFANTSQLHRVRAPGAARTQVTFFDEPVRGASWEPREGRYLVFSMDTGGNEFAQLYRFDPTDGTSTLLTDGGRSQNGGVVWSHARDRIAYTSTRRNGADRDIYLMDPADHTSDRLVAELPGGGWGVLDWSPDDRTLLIIEYLSINHSRYWLVDIATGNRTALTVDQEEEVARGPAVFTQDGRGLWFATDEGSEFRRLAFLDLASRRVTPITTSINWDVTELELSPDGRTLAFTTNEAGIARLHFLDTRTRRWRTVTSLPIGSVSGLAWRESGTELAFTVGTARTAADAYSLEIKSGRLVRWTESETGGLVTDDLPLPELVRWKSFDGLEISGFLYRPPARFTGPRPVLVSIHGGPESQSRPGFIGRSNYYLKELGVAILYPNVRGSTGFGKTFVKLDNGFNRLDAVKDIGALFNWIEAEPGLDGSRVMVSGGSYGGYMSLAVATDYSDRIVGAINVVGISNFVTFLENTESYRRDLRRVEYGDERDPDMRAFMERIAPLNNAHKIKQPLFVVQGANDPRVPRSEAEQMVETVKQQGTPLWYLLAMDEGHGFAKKANADYQFYTTILFVQKYLAGETR
jgi:dipeptidyl aminopeptidase/acylaminoacyl peptidase